MIEIPSKAIKKIKNDVHRDIVASNLIAYGFFPGTSEGINQAKKFVAGLNEWIATTDLPNYYDDIESDLLTHRETAGIRNIRMILEQFYFGGGAEAGQSEQEEIPVEIEVVEVEQRNVDEPVVISVEVPFDVTEENPLRAPKRVKLPRIKNTLRKRRGPSKNTVGQRMAEAFENNLLGPLVDSIINPPPPEPKKERKKKETVASKKTTVKPKEVNYDKGSKDPMSAKSFNEYLGIKIGESFKKAALARKEFIDAGGTAKELKERSFKDRFITKALAFEFGGDKLARTKGTFSSNPEKFQDPALNRGQRFRSGIEGLMSPLPLVNKEEFSQATPADAGVAVDIEPIKESYSNILDGFSFGVNSFESSGGVKEKTTNTLEQFASKIQEVKDLIEEKTKNKKIKLDLKQEKVRAEADAAQTEKDLALESQIEQQADSAKTNTYKAAEGKSLLEILFGKKKKDDGEEGGGNILGDILGIGLEWGGEELAERGIRKLFERGGQQVAQEAGKQVAQKAGMGVGATAAIVGGVGLAASGIGEGLFQLTKKGGAGEQTRDALKKKGEEIGGPMGSIIGGVGNLAGFSTEATKVTGNALDAIGAPFRYAIEAVRYPFLNEEDREKQADNLAKFDARIREYSRGWMNRIDFMNVIPDEKGGFGNIYGNDEAQKEMMQKMSEGGSSIPEPTFKGIGGPRLNGNITGGTPAMVGEAGPELVGNKKELETMAGSVSKEKQDPLTENIRTILGVAKNVISQSGVIGAAIKPFFSSYTAPIAKAFGIEEFNFPTDIGKGSSELSSVASEPEQELGGGMFDGLLAFFGMGGMLNGKGKNPPPGGSPRPLGLGGGQGRTDAASVYKYLLSKGMSENHAKGITANISRESGFRLGAHNPSDPNGGSFGLFQWNAGRATNMMAAVPDWETNWQGQIDYALGEDHGPTYLATQFNSPGEAAYDWMKYWERPAEYIQAQYTPQVYDELIEKMGLSADMPTPPSPTSPPGSSNPDPPPLIPPAWTPPPQGSPAGIIPAPWMAPPSSPTAATPSLAPPVPGFNLPQQQSPQSSLHPLLQPSQLGPRPNAQRGASPAEILRYDQKQKEHINNVLMKMMLEKR